MTTATQTVQITDPTLLFFTVQRETVIKKTMEKFETAYAGWEKDDKELEAFEVEVRNYGSDLQHKKVIVPEKKELEAKREEYLHKFWEFSSKVDRISVFVSHFSSLVQFFTPQPRLYADEQRLMADQPEFYAQLKKIDEVSKEHVLKIGDASTKAKTLKDKMVSFIRSTAGWSVQRFCQIVENNGQPISSWARLVDNLTWPVVPKPLPPLAPPAEVPELTVTAAPVLPELPPVPVIQVLKEKNSNGGE